MKKLFTGSLLCSLLLLLQSMTGPAAQQTATPRTGQELFERHCKQCHGKDGTRGLFGAANLQTSRLEDPALYATIAKGRKIMPAWDRKLDTAELVLVATYAKSLRK
ncbi:c-type cytochrome [Paraflavitalea pollutisoli]|uniref:c-type cytochrome n=1 Tax=Paraflavitalea pollutisoli TaxID=3034143 RepID=UPI0023EC546A|nr:cytochrome c [Paraflavitalea sp. H1-2-19X]